MTIAQEHISLREASNLLPSKPHINTLRRWILKGARGRKLDARLIGGRWFTTEASLQEFLDAPACPTQAPRKLTAAQREATAKARAMGL